MQQQSSYCSKKHDLPFIYTRTERERERGGGGVCVRERERGYILHRNNNNLSAKGHIETLHGRKDVRANYIHFGSVLAGFTRIYMYM